MIVKKVNRYYCEFCGKSGGAGGHIARHEKRCTLNPNRHCGMCAIMDLEQKPLTELLAILPCPSEFWEEDQYGFKTFCVTDVLEKAFATLRDVTDNCPACIMATLRQKGIPVGAMSNFKFSEECKEVWRVFNDKRYDESMRSERIWW